MSGPGFANASVLTLPELLIWTAGCALLLLVLGLLRRRLNQQAQPSIDCHYQLKQLSREAKLHTLTVKGIEYQIFESGGALIQLHGAQGESNV